MQAIIERRLTVMAIALLALTVAACVTLNSVRVQKGRGLLFSHAKHEDALDCDGCHSVDDGEMTMPDHDICSVCHEVNMDEPDPEDCAVCHTDPEWTVTPREEILSAEVIWSHEPHVDAEVACAECHADPDARVLPKGRLMPFCMDCHAKARPELNECSVCHERLRKDVIPATRDGSPIAHNAPQIWENVHGQESRMDPLFCSYCHDVPNACDDCHSKNPPQSHTLVWRRKVHGLRAAWDRQNCAVCHAEESCTKCHEKTAPSSHRNGWGDPFNRHCAECHFPPDTTTCKTCHVSVEHVEAKPSPHDFGLFPARCGKCHPGGNPYRAPHIINSSVGCWVCH